MHTLFCIHLKRITFYLALVLLIPSFFAPQSIRTQASEPSRNIAGIEVSDRFLQQWSASGNDRDNLLLNGLPLTHARPEISLVDGKTYLTQWFERARYELHPDNPAPYDIQLALLGTFVAEGRTKVDSVSGQSVDPANAPFLRIFQPDDLGPTKLWFPETGHSLTGDFLTFWQQFGGLQQFGFPLSEPLAEQSPTDGKTYTVQYFERNRMELHPEFPAPYNVQLGLLGSQLYHLNAIPAADLPIAPPSGITSAKDTYTEGSLQEPDTLFCNEANTVVAQRFCQAITFNDNIVGTDDQGNLFPLAAWYVPTFENGGTYYVGTGDDRHIVTKFKLRPGINWSDGVELTSNDAIFSYKLIHDDPNSVTRNAQIRLASVDNPDKNTIIYNWLSLNQAKAILAKPTTDQGEYAFLKPFIDLNRPIFDLDYAYIGKVHPQHILSTIPIDRIQESKQGQNPTGYGPYIVKEWKQGDSMTIVANPNYNLTAKPLIGTIVTRFSPDVVGQISRLYPAFGENGINGISSEGFVVPPNETDELRQIGYVVSTVPADSIEQLQFKFTFEPFKDRRIRQAFTHAIDRQKIVNTVYKASASLINGPLSAGIFHSLDNPDFATNFPDLAAKYQLYKYNYDPALANTLLNEAGWLAPCGDPALCMREKDGKKLTFEYATFRNSTRQAIQALVVQDLQRLGIDVRVITYPVGCWICDPYNRTDIAQLIELALLSSPSTNFDNWDSYWPNTDQYYVGPNIQRYSNPKVDAANALFKTAVTAHERAEQSAIIQTELMNDAAIIPLAQRANIEIYSGKMMNRKTPNNLTATGWWNIAQWYFVP